jgi:hypothetical protein
MLMLVINLFLEDYIYKGELIDNEKLILCFFNIGPVMQSWVIMNLFAFMIIPLVKFIAHFKLDKKQVILNIFFEY